MKQSATAAYAWEKNEQQQLQHDGTGTPDTTKHEWRENQRRETLSTIILMPGMLTYQSMGLDEHEELVRINLIDKMVQPCGPPPESATELMVAQAKAKLRAKAEGE